jgi:hypothetical protein
MEQQTIKLELTAQDVNTVLGALAQRPFAEVANLFTNIQQQAQSQIQQAPADHTPAE